MKWLIPARARARLSRFRGDKRGVIGIEFAFFSILTIGVLFAGVEFGRFILIGQKADRAMASVADMVTQTEQLQTADLKDMFVAASLILPAYKYKNQGVLIVSLVSNTGSGAVIVWQERSAATWQQASAIGTVGGAAVLPANFTLPAGESSVVVETYVHYTPWLFELATGSPNIYRVGWYRPRKSSSLPYTQSGTPVIDTENEEDYTY